MVQPQGNIILPLAGAFMSITVTAYYVYQIKQADGRFRGSLNSHFDMSVEYSIISGLIMTSFFVIFLAPRFFLKEVLPGLVVSDLIFLSLTVIWMILAQRLFEKMSSMSETYFSGGEVS